MLAVSLLAAAGCSDDPADPDPQGPILPPVNPIDNFCTIYREMLIDEFTNLLHADFQMILLPETRNDWGWADDFNFNKTDQVAIHTKMFRGDPGQDSYGNPIHPIDSIEVDLLEPQGDWSPISVDDPDFSEFDGQWANFLVNIHFYKDDLSHEFEVHQQVIFYVAPVKVDGSTRYLVLGIRELPTDRKMDVDRDKWGQVLSMFY